MNNGHEERQRQLLTRQAAAAIVGFLAGQMETFLPVSEDDPDLFPEAYLEEDFMAQMLEHASGMADRVNSAYGLKVSGREMLILYRDLAKIVAELGDHIEPMRVWPATLGWPSDGPEPAP